MIVAGSRDRGSRHHPPCPGPGPPRRVPPRPRHGAEQPGGGPVGSGWREEALAAIEEAATTYRALAQRRPAVFVSRYSSSLEAQTAILSELGRDSEAQAIRQEAAVIRGND
jgi:hypothetical protein